MCWFFCMVHVFVIYASLCLIQFHPAVRAQSNRRFIKLFFFLLVPPYFWVYSSYFFLKRYFSPPASLILSVISLFLPFQFIDLYMGAAAVSENLFLRINCWLAVGGLLVLGPLSWLIAQLTVEHNNKAGEC